MEQEPRKITREEYRNNLVKIINQKEEELRILESHYNDNDIDPKSLLEDINKVKEKIQSLENTLREHDKNY